MIYPTAREILACVDQTLLDASDETMPRTAVKSALATCRHLIRHAELRMRLEKGILLADLDKASELLDGLAGYLDGSDDDRNNLARAIRSLLAESPQWQTDRDDQTERILARAKALREQVYAVLKRLQTTSTEERATDAYQNARRLLREYMTYQIQQEARMITPAFVGHGPRR